MLDCVQNRGEVMSEDEKQEITNRLEQIEENYKKRRFLFDDEMTYRKHVKILLQEIERLATQSPKRAKPKPVNQERDEWSDKQDAEKHEADRFAEVIGD